jgi:hypothetical protein
LGTQPIGRRGGQKGRITVPEFVSIKGYHQQFPITDETSVIVFGKTYKCDFRDDANAIAECLVDVQSLQETITKILMAIDACERHSIPTKRVYGGFLDDASERLSEQARRVR